MYMAKYTNRNHFKFGYNGQYFNLRKFPEDMWNVKYGRCERNPENFRDECINSAKLIYEATEKNIYVLMSGGLDSEIVARSFYEAKVPFTAVIGRYNNNKNDHDISYAIKFCKAFDVPYNIIDVDVEKFWKEKLLEYAEKTRCVSPQLPVIMYLIDQINGHAVLGSAESYLTRDGYEWYLWEKEKIASWYRHFLINKKEGTPGFFQYTPELMLSYITDDIITNIFEDSRFSSTYYIKANVYLKYWKRIENRSIYTGFEKYKYLDYNIYRPILEEKFGDSNQIVKTEYYDLITILSPVKCCQIPKRVIMLYHHYYEKENMSLRHTPFKDITEKSRYYAAYINGMLAGFTAMDFFKDNKGVYVHGAYTLPEFRGTGINRALWNYKMKEIEQYPELTIYSINPEWLPHAKAQKEMLIRKGFKHTDNRPDGAPVLTCKVKELKNGS